MTTVTDLPALPRHFETTAPVQTSAADAFQYLDDPARLAAHMSRSSWMMAGSKMSIRTDAASGQVLGSMISLRGRILGLRLSVDEVVTERIVGAGKTWQTVGTPRLLVIGHYRMGFAIAADGAVSVVRVFIDYALPDALPARWLGHLFGGFYARWCTDTMVHDAARHFSELATLPASRVHS